VKKKEAAVSQKFKKEGGEPRILRSSGTKREINSTYKEDQASDRGGRGKKKYSNKLREKKGAPFSTE